jgi:hypothetical protein
LPRDWLDAVAVTFDVAVRRLLAMRRGKQSRKAAPLPNLNVCRTVAIMPAPDREARTRSIMEFSLAQAVRLVNDIKPLFAGFSPFRKVF